MIRSANENDIKKIYELEMKFFNDEAFSEVSIREYVNNKTKLDTVKVLEIDNNLVGYIIYRKNDVIELLKILVDEKYQGKKYSRLLMDEMIKDKYDKKIFLEVRSDNDNAIKLYKKYNFEIINIRKNYYKNPTSDAYIMELK